MTKWQILKRVLTFILGIIALVFGAGVAMFAGVPWEFTFILLIIGLLTWIVVFILKIAQ